MAHDTAIKKHGQHKRERRHPGILGPRPDNGKLRQDEARERQQAWAKLSPHEQLKVLDRRPGESKKQRARLQALIDRQRRPVINESPAK